MINRVIGHIGQPTTYPELVEDAIDRRDLSRLQQLAREMALKLVQAERQIEFIIAQLRDAERAKSTRRV